MKTIKSLSSEDAVSEVVDFVTILGILVISIGIIGVAGYPMVKNAQEANYIENTKQSFIVLAENVNKVVLGQSPSQNVEVKLYGGTLSANGSSEINITATDSTNQPITLLPDWPMRSVESTVGSTVIAYEGTGVWARYPDGKTLMVSKPLISNLSNVLVIPAVYVIGTTSVGGNGMSRVVVSGGVPGILVPDIELHKNVGNITVTINSTYAQGWYDYLNSARSLGTCNQPTSSSVNCTLPTNNVDVYILKIQLNTVIT